jgi:ribonuclease HI
MRLVLYADGASRGNPGPAAFGVVLTGARGRVVEEFGKTLGKMTSNEAEYHGLLAGLDAALGRGASELEVRLDSELLVSQLNGAYKVRATNLKPLFAEAQQKLKRFRRARIVHVPRALNSRADQLANQALDEMAGL